MDLTIVGVKTTEIIEQITATTTTMETKINQTSSITPNKVIVYAPLFN
jgi:hypothetical protein